MRILHVAIFLGAVACITEYVLKFVKVRCCKSRTSAGLHSVSVTDIGCNVEQGHFPFVTEEVAETSVGALEMDTKIISGVNCVRASCSVSCLRCLLTQLG